jgi:dihydrofolate reductase
MQSVTEWAVAKLIMWNLMTLDGFVEGENRDISWHLDVWGEELERLSIDQLKSAGGLMFGRVTYDLMANHWPGATGEVADFMNALPKYVFSRTLTTSSWNNAQIFGTDVPDTVARLKRDSAKDIYLFGSADLAASLIPHRLIDEFRIGLNPLLLGAGSPLFETAGKLRLKLLESRSLSNGIVILHYEQARTSAQ